MSEASAKVQQIERRMPAPVPPLRQPKNSIVAWLQTWRQVLIAEVLSAMEHRRWD